MKINLSMIVIIKQSLRINIIFRKYVEFYFSIDLFQ